MNLLSVIVPVYNVEAFLPKCLNSLLNQTYKDLEIILIDDGSTDNSGKICDEYAERDNRIKVIHQKNQGVSAARNVGLDLSTGDYITFVDSDDWCEKDYFENAMLYFFYYDINLLITNFTREQIENNKNRKNCLQYTNKKFLNSYNAIENMVNRRNFGWEIFATFYDKQSIHNIRFKKANYYGEDFEFKYRVNKNKKIKVCYTSIFGYHYVNRADSAVNSYTLKKKMNSLIFQELLIDNEKDEIYSSLLKKKYFDALVYYYANTKNNYEKNIILKNKIEYLLEDKSFLKKLKFFSKLRIFYKIMLFKFIELFDAGKIIKYR